MSRDSVREILAVVVIGAAVFLFFSLYSYSHQQDFLLGGPPSNACGAVGAFLSHQVHVWIGKWSAYMLNMALLAGGVCLLTRKRVSGLGWKVTGLVILLLTFSSIEVAVADGSDHFPGGYYGQFFYTLLLARLNALGSFLILGTAILVAVLISTEAKFFPALMRAGRTAATTRHWKTAGELAMRGARLAGRVRSIPMPRIRVKWPHRGAPEDEGEDESDGEGAVEDAGGPAAEARDTVRGEDDDTDGARPDAPGRTGGKRETGEGASGRVIDDSSPFELKIRSAEPVAGASGKSSGKRAARRNGRYSLPPLDILAPPDISTESVDRNVIQATAAKIEETLRHFKIDARVVEVQRGPVITQYEISLAAGIKVHKIVSLADDLAMALKAESIRIVAPIPGKATVGIEVPNRTRVTVGLRELLESPECRKKQSRLPLAVGKDIAGAPIIGELGDMPHLLIAGSTGSGKSVCINSIIVNLLMTKTPDEVKLILIDPKMVELSSFEEIPHLLTPVVTDMKKAPAVLNWLVEKMEERYELLAMASVRHLTAYNALGRVTLRERLREKLGDENIEGLPDFLPYYVVIIDELADLMMSASKEVEASITRLSQKSRAVGIHVILATQRPSVDVITGLIKANMPSRISFHVASKVDSRTILDRNGSEKLLGKGDMLYLPPGTSNLIRAQGTFISDTEIAQVVEFVRKEAEPQFDEELSRFGLQGAVAECEEDELYEDAVRIVLESQRGSVTLLQRQLQIGYTRASRLMELMSANGLVGPFKGSKAREVYYTLDEWEAARGTKAS